MRKGVVVAIPTFKFKVIFQFLSAVNSPHVEILMFPRMTSAMTILRMNRSIIYFDFNRQTDISNDLL